MRISPINFNNNYKNNVYAQKKEVKQEAVKNSTIFPHSLSCAPSFASMTIYMQYRKLQGKMPERVEKLMQENLKIMCNPKMVNDIHAEAYGALEQCETLAKIKELFPEFSEVKEIPSIYDKTLRTVMKRINNNIINATFEDFVVRAIKNLYLDFKAIDDKDAWFGFSEKAVKKIIAELNIQELNRSYCCACRKSRKEARDKMKEMAKKRCEEDPDFFAKFHAAAYTPEAVKKKNESYNWLREVNPDYNEESRERLIEKWSDPEFRKIHEDTMDDYWSKSENRAKQGKVMDKHWQDPKNREEHGKIMKEHWQDPEYRKKVLKKTNED